MFYGIYLIIGPIFISKGNTLYIMFFSLFCATLNIVINNLLIGSLGMYGAVLGTLFSFFCLSLFTGIYSFNLVNSLEKKYLKWVFYTYGTPNLSFVEYSFKAYVLLFKKIILDLIGLFNRKK